MFFIHEPDASRCLKQPIRGFGIIESDPQRTETGQVFLVNFKKLMVGENDKCSADLLVRVKTKLYPRFEYGSPVIVSGKISQPFNFSNDDGRVFDYRGYLEKDGVYYEIKSAVVTFDEKATAIQNAASYLYRIKHRFVSNLERVLGEPHAALAAGLVVGEKSALGKDLIDDFRMVGLIHIVVLSGFNITIVVIALRRTLSFLPRIYGICLGALGIVMFGMLVGGGATVIRSCCMALVALLADLIRRDYNVKTALALAACIMLTANPNTLLHDPSFQLSFLATVGLILLASPIEEKLWWIPDCFGMRGTIAACLATQIFVSPFILYLMGQVSIIGIIANIMVLPFIPFTMLIIFLAGMSGFVFMPTAYIFGYFAHLLLSYELFIVETFAKIPYAALHIPPFSFWWVVVFYGLFFYFYISRRRSI